MFKVRVEKELKVTLDMNRYNEENLNSIRGIWGYGKDDFTDEEIIEECVTDLANIYLRDGYLDDNLEEFPIEGQICEQANEFMDVEEIK